MSPTTRYFALSSAEKLALTSEQLATAVKLEAIERGVEPPITLDNALRQADAQGFSLDSGMTQFYELLAATSNYGNPEPTGIAFRTREEAEAALKGAFNVCKEGYDAEAYWKMGDPNKLGVAIRWIGLNKSFGYWSKLEAYQQDTEAFDKVAEECRDDLSKVRQDDYNRRVLQVKRAEFLALANGDEAIARAFWGKTQGNTPFPEVLASEAVQS